MDSLIEVKNLKKYFPVTKGLILMRVTGLVKAVDNINFSISPGETFGLVGESGCGKTTTAKLILREEKPTSGSIHFGGVDIAGLKGKELKNYRASVQAVFQDPYSSLDPRMRISSIVVEPVVATNSLPRSAHRERVEEILTEVGLRIECAQLYPHELSGGQRQRVAVARALSLNPSLIILDEPVSALDVSIRAQIMNLLKDLQEKLGVAYLLIAHNLATVWYMSHRLGVMYLGKIVETGNCEEVYSHPLHPYTRALLSAALPFQPEVEWQEMPLRGEVPSALNPPPGCSFHPRCPSAKPICSEAEPTLKEVSSRHWVACHP